MDDGLGQTMARTMRIGVGRVAAVLVGVSAVLCTLGALERLGLPLGLFDFDGEGKALAAWSTLLLLTNAGLALSIGSGERDAPRRWQVLAGFFAFVAVDEALALHEHLNTDLHWDWQVGYLPVLAVGGAAGLLVLRRLWPLRHERILLIAGAAAWAISQLSERVQSNPDEGRVSGYGALSGVEETLEIAGSALFVLALLGALRALSSRAPSRRTA
jgi:hypothetical protein